VLVETVLDRLDHAADLAPGHFQLHFVLRPPPRLLGGQAIDLDLEGAGEHLDQLGCRQTFP
jgi:hypothetical protein